VLEYLLHVDLAPHVLHVHDFQLGLVPSLLRRAGVGAEFFRGTRTVLTIHNLGYQGIYDPLVLRRAGFPEAAFHAGGPLEYWGKTNYLKAGILDADLLTTVSPRYAREIMEGPEFGHGLEGVLAGRRGDLTGILNGIDTATWDPATDPHLAAPYDARDLSGKRRNRDALLARTGLAPAAGRPVAAMVTRLVEQKGIDLVMDAFPAILERGIALAVLGQGRKLYEAFFADQARAHPGRVFFDGTFNEPLAHLLEAGADLFVMPSHYEPCGLNQMISLRYGTVPVVRRVGGLADTVVSMEEDPVRGTGFVFEPYTAAGLLDALDRALGAFRDRGGWEALQRRGMARDVSWDSAAAAYEALYRSRRAVT
jgi:starch synthase